MYMMIFLLIAPSTRPHQTAHITVRPQCTTLRRMLRHAQRNSFGHGSQTGHFLYQRPKTVPIRITLIEVEHPQPANTIIFGNSLLVPIQTTIIEMDHPQPETPVLSYN